MSGTLYIFDPDGDIEVVYEKYLDPDDHIKPESCKEHPAPDLQTSGTGDQPPATEENGEQKKSINSNKDRVHMIVSSKHLKLASPVWRKMFDDPWKEARGLADGKRLKIRTECEDVGAMVILMNITHGHGGKVPRAVTLNKLVEIAVLVDYYGCHEAVDVMAEIWVDKLFKRMPLIYCKDIVSWIFVSWVFQQPSAFTAATRIAATQSQQRIDPDGLPIPQRILDKIEEHRRDGVKSALDMSYKLVADLRDGRKRFVQTSAMLCVSVF